MVVIGGSLFSGIDGFGLGLLWSGLITSIGLQVELDPFCRRVLEARFPHVDRSVQDVRCATAQSFSHIDVLFGGPPCQDISGAGKGAGLNGARSGLVREMLRLVGELGPGVVLLENVASGKRRWVCPVGGALETLGYRTAALNIGVDDCGGPIHRRRIFVLAFAAGARCTGRVREGENDAGRPRSQNGGSHVGFAESVGAERVASFAKRSGESHRSREREGLQPLTCLSSEARGAHGNESEPGVGWVPSRLPARVVRWPAGPGAPQEAWEPPRVLVGVEERAAKLRALGNAVSPVQAYHVGLWAREVLARNGAAA